MALSDMIATHRSTRSKVDTESANAIDRSVPVDADRIVYLMRGLPSCGKSHRSKQLAGERGVICETDDFFYSQVGTHADKYNYRADRQQEARDWNYRRFAGAVDARESTIIVDRGNGLNHETWRYARYAIDKGCTVLLAEPDSPWWQEIRILLKYKQYTGPVLDRWAMRLAKLNRSTHRTPAKTIRRWMRHWNSTLTVEAILNHESRRTSECSSPVRASDL